MNAYLNQYRNNQVATAKPEQLLIMLYDGAIRFARQAREAISMGDRVKKLEMISKTMAIITEFSNTLDREVGGEIADNLDALYDFMIRELTQANLKNDEQRLEVVEQLLIDLRTTWAEAIHIAADESADKGQSLRQGATA
ncbi:MAG TPA: flagellar export chaperone FliS [Desulfuromonadales bacterium]|nr:flagellar export chaperone FliS [Desulfuromonadales bacterium]